jgi:uncharacterized protein YjbI with pentapeptide repeats
MTRFVQQPDYEGAEFIDLSMASATFREVDLSGARMRGVLLLDAMPELLGGNMNGRNPCMKWSSY